MQIAYVVITCDKGKELHQAQLDTCLKGQVVATLGDEDDLDRQLKLLSNGRKTLRWWLLNRTFESDWHFFVDDDTWVFTENLERVCSQLPNDVPRVFTYQCAPWGARHVMEGLFGTREFPQRAQEFMKAKTGVNVSWHGGAGLLMNKKMCELVRSCMVKDVFYKDAFKILRDVKDISAGQDALWAWMLPQDLLMPRALGLAVAASGLPKNEVFKSLTAPNLQATKKLKSEQGVVTKIEVDMFPSSTHPWQTAGTGFQAKLGQWKKYREKCVADFSPSYPVIPGTRCELDVVRAIELSRVHEPTGRKNAHIVDCDANLTTLHRVKKPQQMHALQEAM